MQDAIDAWLDAVSGETEPQIALYWQDIARAHEQREDWAAAADAWRRYLAHFPDSLLGTRRLCAAATRAGQTDEEARLALRLQALEPALPLDAPLSTRVRLAGVGRLSQAPAPGETMIAEMHFDFTGNVDQSDKLRIEFRLSGKEESESTTQHTLIGEPQHLGSPPCWRGDSVRRTFALTMPTELRPGRYRIDAGIGSPPRGYVEVWSFTLTHNTDEQPPPFNEPVDRESAREDDTP